MLYNPSLREEPLDQNAAVIPLKQESSIIDWLESTGRLVARDDQTVQQVDVYTDEIPGLEEADDTEYLFDDDDEVDDVDEE